MLADLRPIADSWRPNVVIHEPNAVAAAPVAARRSIPHVAVGYGGFVPQVVLDAAHDELRSLWQSEKLELSPYAGLYDQLYLHPFPDSFGPPHPAPTVHPMRPIGFDGAAPSEEPPEWVAALGKSRPCVYVTYGTEAFAAQAPFQAVFDALEALDVDAVLTVGERVNIESLPASPPNVHVSGYVPQRFLLERSSLVVSHVGSGTFLGALRYGIPHLCMPISADHFLNADLVTTAGCGLSLDSDQVTSPAIFEAISRLLDDPFFATSARTVAAQIRLMPKPNDLVGRITQCAL
jgi:UDP:flavonoid glycosyltransferase YjiC (YdhE family)